MAILPGPTGSRYQQAMRSISPYRQVLFLAVSAFACIIIVALFMEMSGSSWARIYSSTSKHPAYENSLKHGDDNVDSSKDAYDDYGDLFADPDDEENYPDQPTDLDIEVKPTNTEDANGSTETEDGQKEAATGFRFSHKPDETAQGHTPTQSEILNPVKEPLRRPGKGPGHAPNGNDGKLPGGRPWHNRPGHQPPNGPGNPQGPDHEPTQAELDQIPKATRVLKSKRNGMGVYNTINTDNLDINVMNPTLLELPLGSRHDFMVIARAFHVKEIIDEKEYSRARQIAFFANLTYNHPIHPELVAGNWSKFLVEDFLGPEHHCKKQPNMDKYIGPEDMKLYWTRTSQPLLIFTHQTPDETLCEGQFIVDARAILPELEDALGDRPRMGPIYFKEPTLLHRTPPEGDENNPKYQREKNWAPVQSPLEEDEDELMFMVEPDHLYRFSGIEQPVEEVPQNELAARQIEGPYPVKGKKTWHATAKDATCMHDVMLSNRQVHQSTPMLSLTLCDRGDCVPDKDNTVLLGMIQRRYDGSKAHKGTWYERHIAAYSAYPPFDMMSVSKVLSYHGESKDKYIWTGSMVYHADSHEIPLNRNHGYLSDEIWLSFGIGDKAPGWIDVDARELIKDHFLCQDATPGYMMVLSDV